MIHVPTASKALLAVLALSLVATGAQAQDIDQARKYSWGENFGWMNWRGANAGAQEPRVFATYLSGYVWCENVGWVTLGDGTPTGAGGTRYTNTDGVDTGVNIAANGDLFGFAWSENLGWINFDTRASLTAFSQQARLDAGSRRFRGYAWSENAGWINLDDNNNFVGLRCLADYNDDGLDDILDFLEFINDFSACELQPAPCGETFNSDVNGDTFVDILDFLDFIDSFSAGCP
jgi:hypothetical protein